MAPNERPSFTHISAFRFVFCLLFRILPLTQPDFASPREIAILRSPRMSLLIEITRRAHGMPDLRYLPPWLRFYFPPQIPCGASWGKCGQKNANGCFPLNPRPIET